MARLFPHRWTAVFIVSLQCLYSALLKRQSLFRQHFPQKWGGPAHAVLRDFFRRATRDDFTAFGARFRPKIDNVICLGDHTEIVLDHDDGVPVIDKSMQHIEEQFNIGHVQANGRLFQQIKCRSWLAHFANAFVFCATDAALQLGHELEPLRFTAAQGRAGLPEF